QLQSDESAASLGRPRRRENRIMRIRVAALAIVVAATSSLTAPHASMAATTGPVDPALYKAMRWRGIGPYRGGRALAVSGVSGEPGVFYFGAAAGGVWKTIDSGATWRPIFDEQSTSSIGAIAVAPSNHEIIYVGSGEGALRGNITWGDG